MPSVDPALQPVLAALARGMRALHVRYCLIGALVPELLLDDPPPRRTNDADAVVLIGTMDDFERVKRDLATYGFRKTGLPYRLEHESGGRVDLLPYDPDLARGERLELGPELTFNVAGFGRLAEAALPVPLEGGDEVPVAPVPLYVLLKLVAFSDRARWKDPAGILWCLYHYAANDDRRFGLEHRGDFVPYELTTAYLTGCDARIYLDDDLKRAVTPVLDSLSTAASAADSIATELGWLTPEGQHLHPVSEAFNWFRLGLGS